MLTNKLAYKLSKRIEEGTFRSLSLLEGKIDFCSNDYLGFSKIPSISHEISQFGSTGSRLISGNSPSSVLCETYLADFFNVEAALVFNSGYDANVGFFSAIPQKGDLVIYDEKIHASIRDGIRLSFAKNHSFEHNSLDDLEKKLQLSAETKYIVVESLYSMDGDMAPIVPILELCQKYDAHLIVDEAHAAGVYGEDGKGICDALGVGEQVFARIITFGKAYGAHGAVVLSNQLVKNYLINFARSFIYTTAMPSESYERIHQMVNHSDFSEARNQLFERILQFRNELVNSKFELISEINSPIQVLRIGSVEQSISISEKLFKNDFAVKAILSPTVPTGEEGLRVCIHSFNTLDEIHALINLLNSLKN